MRRALKFAGRALATFVLVLGAGILLAGVLVPRIAGATPYTVLTGSMSPTYPAGTLVVTRPVDAESLSLGDVVTYQIKSGVETVTTHRIVALEYTVAGERRFVTQGDANDSPDIAQVQPAQIRGKVWYAIPYLGRVSLLFDGGQRQWATTAIAVGLASFAGWQVLVWRREMKPGGSPNRRH
ncbi:MAG: signal peptidase I [Promicromonosporaceae bacterium]|nr:signal peptidase I [Promicromonosporaceae bacterium]